MIKVLQIAHFDCAGVMAKTKECFAKYSDRYSVTNLVMNMSALKYEVDLVQDDVKDVSKLVAEHDLVIIHPFINGGDTVQHLMDDWSNMFINGQNVFQQVVEQEKPTIWFLNGSNNLRYYRNFYVNLLSGKNLMCSTPDLKVLFPDAHYAPVMLDLEKAIYKPHEKDLKPEQIRITHCPTDLMIKNTNDFIKCINTLKKDNYDFSFELIMGMANLHTVNYKKVSHINLDHMQGYYGVNSLESAAVEQLNFVKLEGVAREIFYEVAGVRTSPFIEVSNGEEVYEKLKYYLDNPKQIKIDGKKSREWMLKHWHPKKLVARMEVYFDEVLR